jgi:hypothetical protein
MDVRFDPISPFRLPQWREVRVLELLDRRSRPSRNCKYDDTYVRKYRSYLLRYSIASSDCERLEVCRELPHIHSAHVIRHCSDSETRDVLEARVLARQTAAEIAVKLAIEPDTVTAYEKIYFDVRERLDAKTYVAKVVLGFPDYLRGMISESSRGQFLRRIAYYGGPIALEALLITMWPSSQADKPADVAQWFNEALGSTVLTHAMAVALTMEINRHNAMRFLRLALRIGAREASRRSSAEADDLNRRIANMLQTVAPHLMNPVPRTTSDSHAGASECKG